MNPRCDNGPSLPEGLTVHSPVMWPWFTRRHDRWLNRRLLSTKLRHVMEEAGGPFIAVTTLPITSVLIDVLPVERWVYYCVDDFSEWPGLDHRPLEMMERVVAQRSETVIAVSETLQRRLANWGCHSHLLTHGADLDHWRPTERPAPSAALAPFERPLVLFWGLVDGRLDAEFIAATAAGMKQGTIVLVGPEQAPPPGLLELPRVARVPAVGYDELPGLAAEAAALIMPYIDAQVTRAMQPLKLKEYLATGKPAIVRDLPAVQEWRDALDVASSAKDFAAAVLQRLSNGLPDEQRLARARLRMETWAAKAAQFEALLEGSSDLCRLDDPCLVAGA